jgi:hypothetical protein
MSAIIDLTPDELQPVDAPRRAMAVVTPMDLLNIVVQQGADPQKMGQLMLLQERWEANEARKAHAAAFAAFKAEAITIVKGKKITDGPLKGKFHADLFDVVSAVTPALSKHGMSISWKLTQDTKDWIEVTCSLSHAGGHIETVSMGGAPDTGPGRNAIQARCSTKTYLERYTATAILGVAATDADDDGAGGAGNTSAEQSLMKQLIGDVEATSTDAEAIAFWKANSNKLISWPYAYEKFKHAVATHRRQLQGGAS